MNVIYKNIINKFLKDLTISKRGLKRLNFLATDLSPAFLKTGMSDETLQNLEKNTLLNTHQKDQLICVTVHVHHSSEPLKSNQGKLPRGINITCDLLNNLGFCRDIKHFQ